MEILDLAHEAAPKAPPKPAAGPARRRPAVINAPARKAPLPGVPAHGRRSGDGADAGTSHSAAPLAEDFPWANPPGWKTSSPWQHRLGLVAGAAIAVVLSLGGMAALFAMQSGELHQVVGKR